jgi:hypothetical protein
MKISHPLEIVNTPPAEAGTPSRKRCVLRGIVVSLVANYVINTTLNL